MNPNRKHTGKYASHPGGMPTGQHPVDASKQMSHPTHHKTGTVADRALVMSGKSTPQSVYEAQYGTGIMSERNRTHMMGSEMPPGKVIKQKRKPGMILGP